MSDNVNGAEHEVRFWVLDAETSRHLAKETSQVAYLPEAATQTRRQEPSAMILIFLVRT